MTRSEILNNAITCINGNREEDYGSPENNFKMIANLWNAYLGGYDNAKIEPKDVAAMLALLKIARISTGKAKGDNWIDLAGYAACGGEIDTSAVVEKSVEFVDENGDIAARISERLDGNPHYSSHQCCCNHR